MKLPLNVSLLAMFFLFFLTLAANAQCDQNIIISNQQELDDFFDNYPCDVLQADLTLDFQYSEEIIADLSPLLNLTEIEGNLFINTHNLFSLSGLNNLNYINGSLTISLGLYGFESPFDVNSISSFEGLNGLTEVTEDFSLIGLTNVFDFSGLDALTSVGYFKLTELYNLESFDGLNSLETITSLQIYYCNDLLSLESFPDVEFQGGDLRIASLGGLVNLNGLEFIPDTINLLYISFLENIDGQDFDLSVLSNITRIENDCDLVALKIRNLDFLSNLTYVGEDLDISSLDSLENFDGLSNLTEIGGDLSLGSLYSINSFEGLFNVLEFDGSIEIDFFAEDSIMTTIDLSFPFDTIESLRISNTNVTELSGFHSLKYIENGIDFYRHFMLNTLEGFEELDYIGGRLRFHDMEQLDELPAFNSLQLIGLDLNLSDNDSLLHLPEFNSIQYIGGDLIISENPSLEDCCKIYELYVLTEGDLIWEGNAATCSLQMCDLGFSEINCYSFIDDNGNGIWDDGEIPFMDLNYQINPQEFLVSPNGFGNYQFYIDSGAYNIEVLIPNFWELSTANQSMDFSTDGNEALDFYFGFSSLFDINKNEIDFTMAPALCNAQVYAWINYQNVGTLTNQGTVAFEPDSMTSLITSIPLFDYEEDGIYYWNYSDLNPSHSDIIALQLQMPDESEVGETISFNNTITALGDQDQILEEAFYNHLETIVCAIDPNDKLVLPEGAQEESYTLFEDTVLTYTIRFQNTGNYPATNIRVEDTLDFNLDINFFEFVSASHDVKTSLNLIDRSLKFEFNNINLPDSINNEPESHGFVKFRIKRKDDLPEFTPIENTGFIYFDFNSAIVTNTVRNTFVSEIPTGLTSIISRKNKMKISPNPAFEFTMLSFDEIPEPGSKILVVDIQGKLVREMNEISTKDVQLEIEHLRAGIYFISLLDKNGNRISVQKLIVRN